VGSWGGGDRGRWRKEDAKKKSRRCCFPKFDFCYCFNVLIFLPNHLMFYIHAVWSFPLISLGTSGQLRYGNCPKITGCEKA
jgi:hypothetical protein